MYYLFTTGKHLIEHLVAANHSLDTNTVMKTPILPMRSFWYRALNLAPPRSHYNTIDGKAILFCLSNCSDLLDSDCQLLYLV